MTSQKSVHIKSKSKKNINFKFYKKNPNKLIQICCFCHVSVLCFSFFFGRGSCACARSPYVFLPGRWSSSCCCWSHVSSHVLHFKLLFGFIAFCFRFRSCFYLLFFFIWILFDLRHCRGGNYSFMQLQDVYIILPHLCFCISQLCGWLFGVVRCFVFLLFFNSRILF